MAGQKTLVAGQILKEAGNSMSSHFFKQAGEIIRIVKAKFERKFLDGGTLTVIQAPSGLKDESVDHEFFR